MDCNPNSLPEPTVWCKIFTKLSGKSPIFPRSSPRHHPLSGTSFEIIVRTSPSTSVSSSEFSASYGYKTLHCSRTKIWQDDVKFLIVYKEVYVRYIPGLGGKGGVTSRGMTKLDGKTPMCAPFCPFHHPSSTSPCTCITSPTDKFNSSWFAGV